jgi:hypothetical protein
MRVKMGVHTSHEDFQFYKLQNRLETSLENNISFDHDIDYAIASLDNSHATNILKRYAPAFKSRKLNPTINL